MLILNAPSFFSAAWGLIKKFIDPQTARRIQVYSSKEQGLQALQSVIDIHQIPQDYGGTNISLDEAFLNVANDPLLLRQPIELLHVKRKSKASFKQEWHLHEGEYIDLKCYTRSASGVSLTILLNGEPYRTVEQVQCALDATGHPKAVCHTLAEKLTGSGTHATTPNTVSVELQDLDNADKKHSRQSRGYFLIVGDIKRLEDAGLPECNNARNYRANE